MASSHETVPLIGRQDLVQRTLERLLRPDDLRDSPRDFIAPGFYGLGGVGKSRLLQAIAADARTLTPYVVTVDFDPRQAPPATPLQLAERLARELERLDREHRSLLRRLTSWKRHSPFQEWHGKLHKLEQTPISQTVEARDGSQVANVTMQLQSGLEEVTPALRQAFANALARLCVRSRTQDCFGMHEPRSIPLVLVLLDTLELAPRRLRHWLPGHLHTLWDSQNTQHYHVMALAASRQQVTGLAETELPPLEPQAARQLLRDYVLARNRQEGLNLPQSTLRLFREETQERQRLVEASAGIPLLLILLADLVLADGQALQGLAIQEELTHEQRVAFVVEHYLERLAAQASQAQDPRLQERHHLLLAGAVPRRISGPDLLAALLQDLPGTPYRREMPRNDLYQRLARQAFVQDQGQRGLVYHQLVREGVLAHLRATQPDRWRVLQERAQAWFQAQGQEVEALYHRLLLEGEAAWSQVQAAIQAALEREEWAAAQARIGAAGQALDALPSPLPEAQAWLTLFKARLAWAEGNKKVAFHRLNSVVFNNALGKEIREAAAACLETWIPTLRELAPGSPADELPDLPQDAPFPLLLWWAQARARPALHGALLLKLGETALHQDHYPRAEERLRQALGLYRELGGRLGQARALRGLGETALRQGHYPRAEERFRQALGLYRELGDRLGQAYALLGLGQTALHQGHFPRAEERFRQALGLSRELGGRLGQAQALRGLGQTARFQGHYPRAEERFRQALGLYRELGDRLGQAQALQGLGETALRQGHYPRAEERLRQALGLLEAIQLPDLGLNWSLVLGHGALDQAEAHARRGEVAKASQALALARSCQEWATRFMAHPGLSPAAGREEAPRLQVLGQRLAQWE